MPFKFDAPVKGNEHNILVAQLEIENEETFHMKNLYKMVYNWLLEDNFSDVDGGVFP